jgi:ElaB/YqjD/DUF883 family membrane-anchored ribosome-binding protein
MEKSAFEGGVHEPFAGGSINGESATKNGQDTMAHVQSAMGSAKDAMGSAKDALGSGVQAANTEIEALKDQIAKLAQTVSHLVQNQAATTRDQVKSAVGTASETLSQSAAVAQSTFTSVEADMESRIKRNPWTAIAIAALLGLILAKATS